MRERSHRLQRASSLGGKLSDYDLRGPQQGHERRISMAPRRQNPPAEPEPTLRVARAELEREIDERAGLGREFLQVNVQSMDEFERLEAQFHTWDEYNEQLFRTRFTTGKIADEYKRVTFGFMGRGKSSTRA
jgi:hypothetical protein